MAGQCLHALPFGVSADRGRGDLFGRRRIFVIGTAVFAAASLFCGLSASTTQLILARANQGIGAALLIPCSLAIIGATFDKSERGKSSFLVRSASAAISS